MHSYFNDPLKLHQDIQWPVKKEAVVEGDLVIGGLMMVHEREDTITCGPIMPQGGIQALEAMLYTLDRINAAETFLLPNVTLGAHILDDCDKDTYGLEIAVDFIKGKFENQYFSKKIKNIKFENVILILQIKHLQNTDFFTTDKFLCISIYRNGIVIEIELFISTCILRTS